MSIISRLTTSKAKTDPHAERLAAITKLDHDLDVVIGAALAAGVAPYTVVEALERQENAARCRMAAGLRF
jgi:hypothetical protein